MDYAFLEGEDAFHKYMKAGPISARVYLVGMAKARTRAGSAILNENNHQRFIGIATNAFSKMDDVSKLIECAKWLQGEVHFVLRPHPRTSDSESERLRAIATESGHLFSDPSLESTFDFLKRLHMIIAGESSIHLEAVVHGVEPIYYDPSAKYIDHYGYLKNGLVQNKAHNAIDAIKSIENKSNINTDVLLGRAKYYIDTVSTPYFGRSAELVAQMLDEVVKYGEVLPYRWEAVEGDHSLYQLR